MAKVQPYNTNSAEYPPAHREVYHDYDNCKTGSQIKSWHKQQGKDDKKRCKDCIALD